MAMEIEVTEGVLKIVVAVLAMVVAILLHRASSATSSTSGRVNTLVKLDNPKVVDSMSFTDIEETPACKEKGKCVFCRCWKSKTFPYCDGSHGKHNQETGDNLGPLVITKDK